MNVGTADRFRHIGEHHGCHSAVVRPISPPMLNRHRQRPGRQRQRRKAFPPRSPHERRADAIWIYGIHPVLAALGNPRRAVRRVLATRNALARLTAAGAAFPLPVEETSPRELYGILGRDAVHQGVAVEVAPLEPASIDWIAGGRLVVVLDQITDPHNVGAILRSAAAFAADAVITTGRHAPAETGTLAKSASGALDRIPVIEVPNLARAMERLGEMGFTRLGLDSLADQAIEQSLGGDRIALVFGAEGKGLRQRTRGLCDALVRLTMPGAITSLNVSNAAVLALYLARRYLGEAAAGRDG
jgi:23S rRNA (guanosine2251-2'-O)-methyltransferase